jgi:CRP-like cAMP-binding protein
MDDVRSIRVRSLGPHTTIGEMGLITSQLRSATIQAEIPSVLYALSADAYERIKRENGALAQALLTYVIQVFKLCQQSDRRLAPLTGLLRPIAAAGTTCNVAREANLLEAVGA